MPGGGGAAPPNLHSSSSREWGNLKMSLGSFLSENPAQPRLSAPQGSPGQGLTRHPCTQGAPSAGGGTHRARREEDPGVWSPTDPPLCRGPGLPPPLLAWSAQDQPLQPCTLGKALEKVAGSRYTPEGSQPPPPRTDCDPLSPLPALQLWLMAPVWGGILHIQCKQPRGAGGVPGKQWGAGRAPPRGGGVPYVLWASTLAKRRLCQ